MCNCRKEIEAAAVIFLKESCAHKVEVGNEGHVVNMGIIKQGNKLVAASFDEVEVSVQPKKKDGSLGNAKKRKVPFFHSYCPYCGVKFE